jgi:hypothetical protein
VNSGRVLEAEDEEVPRQQVEVDEEYDTENPGSLS